MNQDIKKLWVADLRSGKYKQGRGRLKQRTMEGVKHCCLGVLCELYEEQTPRKIMWQSNGLVPQSVADWAGLTLPDGAIVTIDGDSTSLLVHNDGEVEDKGTEAALPKTFAQIADAIEAQL